MIQKSKKPQVFRYEAPKQYDIVITYGWTNHGICGHTFEMLDYYFLLREHFKVCMVSADLDKETLEQVALEKYAIEELTDVYYTKRPRIFDASGQLLILTDGSLGSLQTMNCLIYATHIFGFRCGKDIDQNTHNNYTLLMDFRVYEDRPSTNLIHYVKKMQLTLLRRPSSIKTNTALIYATPNCRELEDINSIKTSYNFQHYIVIQDKNPIKGLFDKIDSYIYTPTSRQFDCSPRLITEMKYFGKEVIFHNIDYIDKGLEVRLSDIKKGLYTLQLSKDDELISILNRHLE